MSPKEKAHDLINRNWSSLTDDSMIIPDIRRHQRCALECCDEIIESFKGIYDDFIFKTEKFGGYRNMQKYWEDVRKEIVEYK